MNTINMIQNKDDIKINNKILDFLNPDYIYIPLLENSNIMTKLNKNINKEEIILSHNGVNYYSTVSGTVTGTNSNMKIFNSSVNCIIIENDFKEKVAKRKSSVKYINNYSREEVINLLKTYNVCSDIDFNKKIMLVNGIDKDPFEKTVSYIINEYSSKILETIDALKEIFELDDIILAINNNDSENVVNLTNNIGTYPNIDLKLVPNIYPVGYKEVLEHKLLSKKQINEGYIYLNIQDVYDIYNVLKRKKPLTEKLITLAGNAISNSVIINVKIGTSVDEIIKNCCEITNKKYHVVVNGLISGTTLASLDTIITKDITSIFINTCETSESTQCINCGLCNTKCPVDLNPKYILEHKNADTSKCINCGLCTYICPSKINFKTRLGGRK